MVEWIEARRKPNYWGGFQPIYQLKQDIFETCHNNGCGEMSTRQILSLRQCYAQDTCCNRSSYDPRNMQRWKKIKKNKAKKACCSDCKDGKKCKDDHSH